MNKITNEKELTERFEHCGKCLEKKFHCEPGKKAIVVCGGTGCLSSDSQGIIDAFNAAMEKAKQPKTTVFDSYKGLMNNADFEEYGQYVKNPIADERGFGVLKYPKEDRENYINSIDIASQMANSGITLDDLTDDEKNVAQYIFAKEGRDALIEYMQKMSADGSERKYNENAEAYREWSLNHPILATGAGKTYLACFASYRLLNLFKYFPTANKAP